MTSLSNKSGNDKTEKPDRIYKGLKLDQVISLMRDYFYKSSIKKQIKILNELKIREPLDYEKESISLNISSWNEITRLKSCQKEPLTVKWIEDYIKPDDVLFDIGANIGTYSLIAAAATKNACQVYAFEPVSSNFDKLCQNILTNEMESCITALPIALSDNTGGGKLTVMGMDPGRGTHSVNPEAYENKEHKVYSQHGETVKPKEINILTITIDDLISTFNIPEPNHIKIDVEGHEHAVFKGAERLLKGDKLKSIIMEVREEDSMKSESDETEQILIRNGFEKTVSEKRVNKKGEEEPFSYAIFSRK